ncbi:MAG TPA: PQQ-dependent sugar dehydrogenase [Verrucomicrobiae bacterium]|jgi:cytochrome c|nr:PQQ-dependent sugar dehydrogenase [Verrucomicrobiae bacterium]
MKLLFQLRAFGVVAAVSAAALNLFAADKPAAAPALPSGPQTDGAFRKVILETDKDIDGDGKIDDSLVDPMELSVAKDGRVFYIERAGKISVWDPQSQSSKEIGKLDVFRGLEDGLLGLTLDPNFVQNHWIYLYYSIPETGQDANGKKTGENRVARFTLNGGDTLDMSSEKVLIRVATQREECCHSGGSLNFDSQGNLYLSAGDNTNPFGSDGYAPIDKRSGRSPWDAEKSSANPNDLRGKILRVHPEPDGTITIPKGNLFPSGTPGTRPEIYVMGNRNPFRISIDQKNGFLYWGEVGPDAGSANEKRGPAGFDEINQARKAGFFGWPYFIADNKPYIDYDFEAKESGQPFDPQNPVNNSPNNTGMKELPPAMPAFIYYPHSPSSRFPAVNGGGGRTAMAGPVYYYDPNLKSDRKLPAEFDHTLFIYEWSRNWIVAVHLDENDKIKKMEKVFTGFTLKRPIDMELGPDGCLYIIEYGTNWSDNRDSQIVRIEYAPQHASN